MRKDIISPKLHGALTRFFDKTVDILTATTEPNDYGEPIRTWTVEQEDLPARIMAKEDGEIRRSDSTIVVASHEIVLNGQYEITEHQQARIDSVDYDILLVRHDSAEHLTYLDVKRTEHEQAS